MGSVRLPGRPFRAVASPTPAGWLSASIMVAVETGVKVDDGKYPGVKMELELACNNSASCYLV